MPWMICLLWCVFRARYVVVNNQFAVRILHPSKKWYTSFYCAPFYEHNIAVRFVLQGRVDLNHLHNLDDRVKLLKNHTKRKYHKRWSYTWFYYAMFLYTIFNMETRYIFGAYDKKNWVAKKRTEIQHTKWQFTDRNGWKREREREGQRERYRVRKTEMVEIVPGTKEKMLKWKWP